MEDAPSYPQRFRLRSSAVTGGTCPTRDGIHKRMAYYPIVCRLAIVGVPKSNDGRHATRPTDAFDQPIGLFVGKGSGGGQSDRAPAVAFVAGDRHGSG